MVICLLHGVSIIVPTKAISTTTPQPTGGGSLLLSYFSLFAFLTPFIYFMSNLYYYDYHLIACLGIAAAVVIQKNTTTTAFWMHSTHDFVFLCTQCSSVNMKEWKTCSTTHIYHTPFFWIIIGRINRGPWCVWYMMW